MVVYICRCYFLHLSHSLLSVLTFQQTSIYQCQLFKTFSISQPSCIFIQPVNYENLPQKKLYDFFKWLSSFSSYQLFSLTLYNSMECSIPGLPIHHQLPEFTQTQVHWVSDAIQPSHPLLSPSPPAFNLSLHQGLFKWITSLKELKKLQIFFLNLERRFTWYIILFKKKNLCYKTSIIWLTSYKAERKMVFVIFFFS